MTTFFLTSTMYRLLQLAIVFSSICRTCCSHSSRQDHAHGHVDEMEWRKPKIAQLEANLNGIMQNLHNKSRFLSEKEQEIKELTNKIYFLENVLKNVKNLSSQERIQKLDEEVKLLWAASGRNNFELHNLYAKTCGAKKRLELLSSEFEKMKDIVTDQWIQVWHLEQALEITAMKFQKSEQKLCPVFKVLCDRFHDLCDLLSSLETPYNRSCYLCASHPFYQMLTVTRKYHHKLQETIKHILRRNEFAASIANDELIFFLASALITFPLASAVGKFISLFNWS